MTWHELRGIARAEVDTVLLDLPDVRQRSDYDCGHASVEIVARYHGITKRLPRLANPIQGMDPATVAAVIRSLGLSVLSGTMHIDDLRHYTRTGRPVICPVDMHGGHWLVVRGVERGGVYYQCPIDGAGRVTAARFVEMWNSGSEAGAEFCRWGIVAIP